jgi:integrase
LKRLNGTYRVKIQVRKREFDWSFELRWWDGTSNHRLNLNSQDLDIASKARDKLEARLASLKQSQTSLTDNLLISDLISKYIENYHFQKASPNTIKNARWKLSKLLKEIGDVKIELITPQMVKDYISNEFKRGREIRGVFVDFRAIRAALNWAVKEEFISENPCNKVDFPKLPRLVPKRLSAGQFGRIYNAIDRTDHRLIALTFILTGMRQEEVLNLKWSNIDFESKIITFKGKGQHEREVTLSDTLSVSLNELKRENEFVFPGYRRKGEGMVAVGRKSSSPLRKHFRTHFENAGVTGRGTFHRFRHTTASALAEMGFTELDIGVYLGHANQTVTSGYVWMGNNRLREMAKAMDEWVFRASSSESRPTLLQVAY